MRRLAFLITATALLTASADRLEARAAKKVRLYVVQPGDSCWSIAQRFFGNGRRYDIVHRYNRLGPLPHLLKPGQTLRLPLGTGEADARVRWLRRDVKARSPRSADWTNARRDMELWKLYRVTTGDRSSAGIRFVDQSGLHMREKALLVIYGSSAKRSRLGRRVKTTVVLERGTVKGGLGRLDREAGLVVRTPSSRVTLRSKLSQVEVDRVKTSIVSVYQGVANVLARGLKVLVPTDHGTWVVKGRAPVKPVPLPPAPKWAADVGDAVVLVPAGQRGGFEARWTGPARAQRYRVEVARDVRFNQIMVDAVVGAGIRRFQATKLALGTYWARVATIDRHRLEGRPTQPIRVQLLPLRSSRRLARSAQGHYLAVGLLKLDLRKADGAQVEVSVDGGPYVTATRPVRLSTPGLHVVRCRLKGRKTVSELRVKLLAVRSRLTGHERGLGVGGAALPLSVALVDERGRPAVLPGLVLTAEPGGALPLRSVGAGRFAATLPAPTRYPGARVRLTLSWAAGVLASVPVRVTSPPPRRAAPVVVKRAPARPPVRWNLAPAGFEWSRTGPGLPSRAGLPTTHLGLSSVVADRDAGAGGREVALRLALRGGLTLWRGRLGIDAELPWFSSDVTREITGRSELGDLRLGARVVAWSSRTLRLTPTLRITAPTAGYAAARRVLSLEPGVIFEWQHRQLLTLGTNQVLVADASVRADAWSDSAMFYASSYYALVSPLRWLAVAAELGLAAALTGPAGVSGAVPVTLGGTVWFRPGRFRIGLTAAGGLSKDAQRLLGRYTFGLSFDLAFRGL